MIAEIRAYSKAFLEAGQQGEISWTQVALLRQIVSYSQGRLGGCIARVCILAKNIGRSLRHTRRLLSDLEKKGWLHRQERRLPETNGRLSNIIQLSWDWHRRSISWQDTRPNNYATAIHPEDQEMLVGIQQVMRQKRWRRELSIYYEWIQNNPRFQQFLRYYQQQRPDICNMNAYVQRCVYGNERKNIAFWQAWESYLTRLTELKNKSPEPKNSPVHNITLETVIASIGNHLNPKLRERMQRFYERKFKK